MSEKAVPQTTSTETKKVGPKPTAQAEPAVPDQAVIKTPEKQETEKEQYVKNILASATKVSQ